MTPIEYYRGGNSLKARRTDVRFDRATGLVKPTRGVSVNTDPEKVRQFGGAYRVTNVPPGLRIVQISDDPGHYEIIPTQAMTFDEYQRLLDQSILVPP